MLLFFSSFFCLRTACVENQISVLAPKDEEKKCGQSFQHLNVKMNMIKCEFDCFEMASVVCFFTQMSTWIQKNTAQLKITCNNNNNNKIVSSLPNYTTISYT